MLCDQSCMSRGRKWVAVLRLFYMSMLLRLIVIIINENNDVPYDRTSPKKLRDTAYISLIRPALEYSCSVWHPHKKSNKDKIEKVQRRAARFVSNNFRRKASVSEMLHNLGWQSLDSRRQDQRLVLFYKIINGLASVETEDILTPADSRTRKNHSFKFKHLQANCDSYRYSFFPATISSWNNLPFGIEKVDSVEGFKLKLKEHTFRSP